MSAGWKLVNLHHSLPCRTCRASKRRKLADPEGPARISTQGVALVVGLSKLFAQPKPAQGAVAVVGIDLCVIFGRTPPWKEPLRFVAGGYGCARWRDWGNVWRN